MKIFIASDHAGFELKQALIPFLENLGHEVTDCGAKVLNPEDDYPEFISQAALGVFEDIENARGIIIGGSGQGEAIVANRLPSIRAAVYYGGNLDIVKLSREHNDANVLSLGARFVSVEEAQEAVKLWLETTFSGEERHTRRINQIDEIYG